LIQTAQVTGDDIEQFVSLAELNYQLLKGWKPKTNS